MADENFEELFKSTKSVPKFKEDMEQFYSHFLLNDHGYMFSGSDDIVMESDEQRQTNLPSSSVPHPEQFEFQPQPSSSQLFDELFQGKDVSTSAPSDEYVQSPKMATKRTYSESNVSSDSEEEHHPPTRRCVYSDSDSDSDVSSFSTENLKTIKEMLIGIIGFDTVRPYAPMMFEKGFHFLVWDKSDEIFEGCEHVGVFRANSPSHVAQVCDVIIGNLTDPCNFELKHEFFSGFCKSSSDYKGYIELNVKDEEMSIKLGEEIEKLGGRYVETIVVGISEILRQSVILACGNDALCIKAYDLLLAISDDVGYCGKEIGGCRDMYLNVKSLLLSVVVTMAELLVLARGMHFKDDLIKESFNACFGATEGNLAHCLLEKIPMGQSIGDAHDELQSSINMHRSRNEPVDISSAADRLLEFVVGEKYSNVDISHLTEILDKYI